MMEEEIIKWFIANLKPPYYEKLVLKSFILQAYFLLGSVLMKVLGARR